MAVVDSASGATVTGEGQVIASDGTYADTASLPGAGPVTTVGVAYERRGVYTLRVTAAGYTPWAQHGVRVFADDCHVHTVSLVASLVR